MLAADNLNTSPIVHFLASLQQAAFSVVPALIIQ